MSSSSDERPFRAAHYSGFDGLRLYYRDYGASGGTLPALLCLPGLSRNSKDFHRFALRMADRYRVICPDYRGRGESAHDPDWRHYDARIHLEDLRHLLALLNLHRVVAVGISFGGVLAMGMGAAMPTALAGAFLNDVGPDINAEGLDRIIDYLGTDRPQPDWPAAIAAVRAAMPALASYPDAALEDLAHGTYRRGEDGLLHVDWDPAIVRPLIESKGAVPDLWPLFRSLRHIPLAAVRGGLSDVLDPETFDHMAREIPAGDFVTIDGVGHVPAMTDPRVMEVMNGLLERCGANL